MKKYKLIAASSFLVSALLLAGCTESFDWSQGVKSTDLVFQTFMPTEGAKGTTVTIQGNNFGTDPAQVKVWVNDVSQEILSVDQNFIKIKLADGTGSGKVKVQVGETQYVYPDTFTYAFVTKVSTVAGNGTGGTLDGDALKSQLIWPISFAWDSKENCPVFLQDDGSTDNIRRLKDGKLETLCDVGDMLANARSIAFSVTGDTLFIGADGGNTAVAMVTRKGGFNDLQEYIPYSKFPVGNINGIAVNPADGSVFTYHWPKYIYRYDATAGNVEEIVSREELAALEVGIWGDNTVIDDGTYGGLAFSPDGKTLYHNAKNRYQGILKADYDIATHRCSNLMRFAGSGCWGNDDGQGTAATIDQPGEIKIGPDGNLYVVSGPGHTVRMVTPEGYVSTIAGKGWEAGYQDGVATDARFRNPEGLIVAPNGDIYVGDCNNFRIRLIHKE